MVKSINQSKSRVSAKPSNQVSEVKNQITEVDVHVPPEVHDPPEVLAP